MVPVVLWSALFAAYSLLAVWKEHSEYARIADIPTGLEAALSLVIGLLLAFRVNRAFDRWWEGRTLWGTLVNASRNLGVKINNLVHDHDESFQRFCRLLAAYPYALRDHLRDGANPATTPGLAGEEFAGHHLPAWIVNQIYGILEEWKLSQRIQYGEFRMIDRELRVLLDVCGGCERIRDTPIAASFRSFLNQAIVFLMLTLPWGLATDFGMGTVAIVFLTAYFVLSAAAIAEHVEHPFYRGGNRLELDALCDSIDRSLSEILGVPEVHSNPSKMTS